MTSKLGGITRRALVLALGLALGSVGFSVQALAAAPVQAHLSAQDEADLHRIETYLNNLHTMKADFEQSNPDGSVSSGKLMLSRPGKMRFEYAPPTNMLIVSDGDNVAVDDKDVKNITYYPVSTTPAWFLLREGIKLSGDVTVTKFARDPGAIRVTAVQTKHPDAGSITMVFSLQPLQLVKWIVVDPQQNSTTVALQNQTFGMSFPASLFYVPNRNAAGANTGR
ncbi:MAG TPA: outer membrane lipoprotein carrier protein LolA [Stellaceae bacterium]|nr:outer membrane lipoprotein carrier protein LolA [Stellaceae bacterium]